MLIRSSDKLNILNFERLVSIQMVENRHERYSTYSIFANIEFVEYAESTEISTIPLDQAVNHFSKYYNYHPTYENGSFRTKTNYVNKKIVLAKYSTYETANYVMGKFWEAVAGDKKLFDFPDERINKDWENF